MKQWTVSRKRFFQVFVGSYELYCVSQLTFFYQAMSNSGVLSRKNVEEYFNNDMNHVLGTIWRTKASVSHSHCTIFPDEYVRTVCSNVSFIEQLLELLSSYMLFTGSICR